MAKKANSGCEVVLIALGTLLFCAASLGETDGPSINIGAIIAFDTLAGKIAKTAIELAVEDVNRNTTILNDTLLNIDIRDSTQDALTGASAALGMIRNGCVSIVGPQTSVVAEFVGYLGVAAHVPIVTFSATNPSISMHRYPYFIRTVPNGEMQMTAIAKLTEEYRWREMALVYVDDDFGRGAIPALNGALREVRAKIVSKDAVPPQANVSAMRSLLEGKLMKLESRVFIVHMQPDLCLLLFSEAANLGLISSDYVWIITDGFANLLESFKGTSLVSMNGVLGVKRKLNQTDQPRLKEFGKRWKQRFRAQNATIPINGLNAQALVAYDTVWAVAIAIHDLVSNGLFNGGFSAASSGTEILNFKVFDGGEKLLNHILETDFHGLSGRVQISRERGEPLESSYDIINVVGNSSKKFIGAADQQKTPRGWEIPALGKKLRIGVPWQRGIKKFVSVKPVPASAGAHEKQTYDITGFCIDIFNSVLNRSQDLNLTYEFIPFGAGNVAAGYYDNLVLQVYYQNFDAVVGDVTVLANRSRYVDFTQPYTESGLIMMVAISDKRSSDSSAFLHPFTPAMWITTFAFFIFTGAVVWFLEHRKNRQFRGRPREQVFTFIWFSFSTVYTTQRETIVSGLGRAVVAIWLFVVFVLVSSYTASLSSMLTVKQIVPNFESLESLIAQNLPIGYHQGSFIDKYLVQQLCVNESVLRPYLSIEEYADALKKGPNKGGVAAIFEEQTIAQNLFLSTGCSEYARLGPLYKTGGFAFVFPKGSPLVSEISKAILDLSESKEMQDIRNKWFTSSENNCNIESSALDSNKLSLNDFWGIFVFTGCVSSLALVYYLCRLLYRFMHGIEDSSHDKSIAHRLRTFANYADKKEIPAPKRKRRSGSGASTSSEIPVSTGHI